MLAPDARAVLRDQLRPPGGYELDRAVATTFTLDLSAALVAPLAFASFGVAESPDPITVMEAIRTAADRIDVFCQAGNLIVPRQASDLMTFLESMVHTVVQPRPGRIFHPKIWLLRYVAEDAEPRFRFLCGTRNLTNDRAWDAVVRLDATLGSRPHAKNRLLAEFVRTLPERSTLPMDASRTAAIEALAEDVRRLDWEHPDDVTDLTVHVLGIPGGSRPDFSGYRHLVISPFVNDRGLAELTAGATGPIDLVSRPESLDRLSPESLVGVTSHIVSPLADLGDDEEVIPGTAPLVGLHAKIVVVERQQRAHVFVGSMNATDAAMSGGNIEVVVELEGGYSKLGVATFLGADAPFRSLLEDYQAVGGVPPDPNEDALRRLEQLLREIAVRPFSVTVSGDADVRVAELLVPPLPGVHDVKLQVGLLSRPELAQSVAASGGTVRVGPLALADITPFVVVTATDGSLQRATVVRALLIDDPPGRLDAVLARQVDTPDKLMRFLLLVLGLGDGADGSPLSFVDGGSVSSRWDTTMGLFELLVRALASNPKAIDDIDRLVGTLRRTDSGSSLLPEGFADLWDTVLAARDLLAEAVS